MKNPFSFDANNITCVGQFDADELEYIKKTPEIKAMVEAGHIGLDFSGYDCGTVWVKLKDKEAFELASEIVM